MLFILQDIKLDNNEFYIANKKFPEHIIGTNGLYGGFGPAKLYRFEEGQLANQGYHYIKKVNGWMISMWGTSGSQVGHKDEKKGQSRGQLWKLEKVEDNLGVEWDWYRHLQQELAGLLDL